MFSKSTNLLDLYKPLARGRAITLHGLKYWIPLQYEKIPRFCFKCGRILHVGDACSESDQSSNDTHQFGTWLRAVTNGRRGHKQQTGASTMSENQYKSMFGEESSKASSVSLVRNSNPESTIANGSCKKSGGNNGVTGLSIMDLIDVVKKEVNEVEGYVEEGDLNAMVIWMVRNML